MSIAAENSASTAPDTAENGNSQDANAENSAPEWFQDDVDPAPADLDGDDLGADGLVEMEIELTRLLVEYDDLQTAWPKCPDILIRAKIGRRVADTLARIADLENDIIATPARTPAEAAVRRRRIAALERAGIIPWAAF